MRLLLPGFSGFLVFLILVELKSSFAQKLISAVDQFPASETNDKGPPTKILKIFYSNFLNLAPFTVQ
jgi:hypothetical protein